MVAAADAHPKSPVGIMGPAAAGLEGLPRLAMCLRSGAVVWPVRGWRRWWPGRGEHQGLQDGG